MVLVEECLAPVLDARLDVLGRGEARPVPGKRPCRGQPHLAAWGATFENAKNGQNKMEASVDQDLIVLVLEIKILSDTRVAICHVKVDFGICSELKLNF